MATKTIVIVGITGNQGASVADVFLNQPGWHIRGITRDPSKPSAKAWSDKGVEMVAGDLDHIDSLKTAFQGAHVIFGVTDFWQHIKNPAAHEQAAKQGRAVTEIAYDEEVRQGKTIVDAVAANAETLERFVLSTASEAKAWSQGKVRWNLHFDAKWEAVKYLRAKYPELDKKTSLLQVGVFASNWKGGQMVPVKQEDGKFKLGLPMSGDRKFPIVDPRSDVGPLVKALVDLPAGKNLVGAGSYLTWNEWCGIWSKINGVTCTFEQTDRKIMEESMGAVGVELADMFQYIDEFGYDGSDPSCVYPWDLGIPVKITPMEEYIKKEDWSSVLSGGA